MVKVDGYEVPEGLYYTKEFEWLKIEGDKVRVGITDYAQKQLREIVYAELPSVGGAIKQNDPYGTQGGDDKKNRTEPPTFSSQDSKGSTCIPYVRKIEKTRNDFYSLKKGHPLDNHMLGPLVG